MPRIDQAHRQPPGLKDLVDRDPIHARGFHFGHGGHLALPCSQSANRSNPSVVTEENACTGVGITIRRDRDEMFTGSTIDPGRMGIHPRQ